MEANAVGLRPKASSEKISDRRPVGKRNFLLKSANVNPLLRLTERLLNWDFMHELVMNDSIKSIDADVDEQNNEELAPLPDIYETYEDYVEAWEPVMIKEIQDSTLSKFFGGVDSQLAGSVLCTVIENRSTTITTTATVPSAVMSLECKFSFDTSNTKR